MFNIIINTNSINLLDQHSEQRGTHTEFFSGGQRFQNFINVLTFFGPINKKVNNGDFFAAAKCVMWLIFCNYWRNTLKIAIQIIKKKNAGDGRKNTLLTDRFVTRLCSICFVEPFLLKWLIFLRLLHEKIYAEYYFRTKFVLEFNFSSVSSKNRKKFYLHGTN